MTAEHKRLVTTALGEFFAARDPSAVERYFSAKYRQHNPYVADGPDGLRTFFEQSIVSNSRFTAQTLNMIADGDLVGLRCRYTGFGERPLIGFDIFRIENGKLAEHWDCLQEEPEDGAPFPSGDPELAFPDETHGNRLTVGSFMGRVALMRAAEHASDFALPGANMARFLREGCAAGSPRQYHRVHRLLADGNLVLVQSEGTLSGRAFAFYDLFRMGAGRIVDHWGVRQEVPASSASGLGMF